LAELLSPYKSVSDVFNAAFNELKRRGARPEYIYKSALTHKILLGTHSLRTASMLTEFRVGGCKADVVILNGTATAYEVKSERDSLNRLERQVCAYRSVFARVYVISADEHIHAVQEAVPNDVGILQLNGRHQISTLRDAQEGQERISPTAILDSVRTREAALILKFLGIPVPDVPNTRMNATLKELFFELDPVDAHRAMVHVLKRTRNLSPLSEFVGLLPPSLQTAALSVGLRRADRPRLAKAVDTKLHEAMRWA